MMEKASIILRPKPNAGFCSSPPPRSPPPQHSSVPPLGGDSGGSIEGEAERGERTKDDWAVVERFSPLPPTMRSEGQDVPGSLSTRSLSWCINTTLLVLHERHGLCDPCGACVQRDGTDCLAVLILSRTRRTVGFED
ncbi:hypothetical protein VTO42DRAFT_2599 [Malbranchea cinnamomea]